MRQKQNNFEQRSFIVSKNIRGICNMLALIMFGYALLEKDVPVGMIALAVIAGLTPEGQKIGSVNISQSFRQMMYGFSLTLFIGALFIMLF